MHCMKTHIIIFLVLAPFLHAMDYFPRDVLRYLFATISISATDHNAKIQEIFYIPKEEVLKSINSKQRLQDICLWRGVNKRWNSFLTIDTILDISDIDVSRLAQLECHRAAD